MKGNKVNKIDPFKSFGLKTGPLDPVYKKMVKEAYERGFVDQHSLQMLKNSYSSEYGLPSVPNVELIRIYNELIKEGEIKEDREFLKLLRKRGVRSQSGICNVTVLTKAFPCPGKCIFCPTEPAMPKSYLSNEPAMMRAVLNQFDPYRQVRNRIVSLHTTGHFTDKVDVVVAGGTFSFYPKRYKTDFIRNIYNALNYPLQKGRSLEQAQLINETAQNRCIGLSIETRPDHIDEKELIRLRSLGCTKIEIGVQSLNDNVLELNQRGHGVAQVKKAMQLMKDAGFKINVHMMPNLLGATPEMDLADMRELFSNSVYRPDWLKVYPCMVVPWSLLEGIYKKGGYQSYDNQILVNLLVEMHKIWPEYVRVTRVYRDIPSNMVISGSKASNLRQVVEAKLAEQGIYSRDIRSREIKDQKVDFEDLELKTLEFESSGGKEFFLSYNQKNTDRLCALLRLRFSSYSLTGKKHFIKELNGAALIREIHAYGEQVAINKRDGNVSQHIGLGKRLIGEAERLAKEAGFKKMAVISGIGVREYYRKRGYKLEGTYMTKYL